MSRPVPGNTYALDRAFQRGQPGKMVAIWVSLTTKAVFQGTKSCSLGCGARCGVEMRGNLSTGIPKLYT